MSIVFRLITLLGLAGIVSACVTVNSGATIYNYAGQRYLAISQSAIILRESSPTPRVLSEDFVAVEQPDGSWRPVNRRTAYREVTTNGTFVRQIPSNEIKFAQTGGVIIPTNRLRRSDGEASSSGQKSDDSQVGGD